MKAPITSAISSNIAGRLVLLLSILIGSGCGQTGDLYLPTASNEPVSSESEAARKKKRETQR